MPAARLAVDLSTETIRVVEGMPGTYMRCGETGLPAGAMQGGRVLDEAAVGQALRQVVARAEITASRALIAASDSVASFRILSFPGDATDADIGASVKARLDLGSDRMAHRYLDVPTGDRRERQVFAAVWDRRHIDAIAGAVRLAGLDPVVVDLKSLCLARTLPVDNCILVDLTGNPCEAVLVDGRVPRLWHTFRVDLEGDVALDLANGLRPMLGFNQRHGFASFTPESPILVRAEPGLSLEAAERLESLSRRSVQPVPIPPRVGEEVRYIPYLTCLGLIMRRRP